MMTPPDDPVHSAWNPGVHSAIPVEFRSLETIVRGESVTSTLAEVLEAAQLTGLPHQEITAFRASRLALHELIVRVTADFAVPEGEAEEIFGSNFRQMSRAIWNASIDPELTRIEEVLQDVRAQAEIFVARALSEADVVSNDRPRRRVFGFRLGEAKAAQRRTPASVAEEDFRFIASFKNAGLTTHSPLERAAYKSLYRVLASVFGRLGRLGGDTETLVRLVATHVCNTYGSQVIGERLAPLIESAAAELGFARVANQPSPILISLKGASAAGKSSLRPQLKDLFRVEGIAADGYATISPDVWRRLLLDYDALGSAYKYAGHLTSREVMIIDSKLDAYITEKAERQNGIPHILVDRFRFDSFSDAHVPRVASATYARYVRTMYMYFVVTPPEETVTRGWERALARGRYKSVQDFLGHSVEAYSGMPKIFFRWLNSTLDYRYTFLDNDVQKNTFPRTIAVGNQKKLEIHDLMGFINIERYRKININATEPDEVFQPTAEFEIPNNCHFLRECIQRIPCVTLLEPVTGLPFASLDKGRIVQIDSALWKKAEEDSNIASVLSAVLPDAIRGRQDHR